MARASLSVSATTTNRPSPKSGYFVPGSIALRNLAYIALGDPAGVAR